MPARGIDGVVVHQMHALHDRPYLAGAYGDRLSHVSYFLSHVTRPHFMAGTIGLVPAHFSEVYQLMRMRADDPIVIAAASPPDRHGYFSLGVSADYTASFIGRARFFLEVTEAMPQDVRAQPDPRLAGRRMVPERPAAGRRRHRSSRAMPIAGSPSWSPNASRTGRRSRPGSARSRTRSCMHCTTIAISVCTPSCCPTAWSTSSSRAS